MQLFIEQILNGLATGSIYALITLGLALVYGVMKILHIAHASVYTVGAYIGLAVYKATGSLPAAFLSSIVVCSLFGVLIHKVVYAPLLKYPPYVPLIGSIAVLLGTEEVCRLIAGPYILAFPAKLPLPPINIGAIHISPILLGIYITTAVTVFLLWYIVTKTELGLAMRTASQSRAMAEIMGINFQMIISMTFIIGSSIAAVAGIMVGIYYNQVFPTMGAVPAYKTLALIVVAGLGSLPGAVVASLLLGVTETLLIGFAEVPLPRDSLAFIAMIIVLMWRSEGLFGSK